MAKKETFSLRLRLDRMNEANLGKNLKTFPLKNGGTGVEVHLLMSRRVQPDMMGNTHSIYIPQTDEERRDGLKPIFVGNSKLLKRQIEEDDETPF